MNEEDVEYFKDYRKQLQKVVDKSEDEFEKRLLYIAAGALGLSLSFITDIVTISQSTCLWMLIAGWGLLIVCILINLLSHIGSKNKANESIDLIDAFLTSGESDNSSLIDAINKKNSKTELVNKVTVWSLFLGIVFIVTFASINLLQNNTSNKMAEKEIKIVAPTCEVRNGRTMQKMAPIKANVDSVPTKPNIDTTSKNNK